MKRTRIIALLFAILCALCAPTIAQPNPGDLRVLSWNILHGGRDDGNDIGPQRVIEIIRQSNADIVALQETYGSGQRIAQALGFNFHPRGTNVSILSRYPVLEDISVFEDFKCVGALIKRPDGSRAAVYSIWLPYDKEIWEEGTRDTSDPQSMLDACQSSARDLKQIHALITERLVDNKYKDIPIIIAGDFNSMSHLDYSEVTQDQHHAVIEWPTSRVLTDQDYRDAYRETHPLIDRQADRTWTPRFPGQEQDRIDFIYYNAKTIRAKHTQVIDQHPVKFPSDHAALLAVFEPKQIQPAAATINAMTYNIRHGVGTDNTLDLDRIAAVLEQHNPDIIALQEVDLNAARSNETNQAAYLAGQLNMHPAFARFMPYQGGNYGIAILSRFPITRVQSIPLPKGNEPRVALAVDTRLPNDQVITAIAVHFDWVNDDTYRYAQAKALAQWIDKQHNPCILMGDLNDTPGSRTLKLFTDRASEATKPNDNRFTFSSTDPKSEIDFIFCIPPHRWAPAKAQVIHESLASDHRPVTATLQLHP